MRQYFLAAIAVCGLAACTTVGITDRYGRQYDSFASYLSSARSINEDILVRLETLPVPLGGSAVVVVPTRGHLQMLADASYVGPEQHRNDALVQTVIKNTFDYNEMIWSYIPRDIERRKIFDSVTVIRSDDVDGITVPKGGYLFWGERHRVDNATGDYFHMRADGEREMTDLPETSLSGHDELDSTRLLLGVIEDFVRTHRPQS